MLPRCQMVRLGLGIRKLPPCKVEASSILFWWFEEDPQNLKIFSSPNCAFNPTGVVGTDIYKAGMLQAVFYAKKFYTMKQIHNINNKKCLDFDDFESANSPSELQQNPEEEAEEDETTNEETSSTSTANRLSTINEGTNEDDSDFATFVSSYFSECTAEETWRIREVYDALQRESEIDEEHPISGNSDCLERPFYVQPTPPTEDFNIYAHYVKSGLEFVQYGEPDEFDESGNPCVEIYFSHGMGKCLMDDSNLSENDM